MSQEKNDWPTEALSPPYLDIPDRRDSAFGPPCAFMEMQGRQDPSPIEFHAGHSGWLVTGYDLARRVLSDKRFSVRVGQAHGDGAGTLLGYSGPGLFHLEDPPEHTRLRKTVSAEFALGRVRAWEPTVVDIANRCLDAFIGEERQLRGDLVTGFAQPFPALVVADYLGMPGPARDAFLYTIRRQAGGRPTGGLRMLQRLFRHNPASARDVLQHAVRRVISRTSPRKDRAEALATVTTFLKRTMATVEGADSVLGRLADRADISDDESAGVAAQVLIAGSMVPASMLGLALHLLLSRPDGLAPFAQDSGSADRATEEVFRYLSFESQPRIRVATQDVEIGDVRIGAGQLVAVALETANRDPGAFIDPDVLDFDRDSSKHLAFGWGVHQCLGQNLARLEIRVALQVLAQRLPGLRLEQPGEPRVRDDFIVHSVSSLPVSWGRTA